ncbi:hypothetical protein M758_10G103600 [Ceratodon purpureus]|nr:hypothetical protein M758_10G103600 [Ceratodon purpureus]
MVSILMYASVNLLIASATSDDSYSPSSSLAPTRRLFLLPPSPPSLRCSQADVSVEGSPLEEDEPPGAGAPPFATFTTSRCASAGTLSPMAPGFPIFSKPNFSKKAKTIRNSRTLEQRWAMAEA